MEKNWTQTSFLRLAVRKTTEFGLSWDKPATRFFCLALFLAVFFSEPSSRLLAQNLEEGFEVYRTLPNHKSLLTSPQFLVIDDFNLGKFKNRRGATWQIKSPTPGALDISLVKEDARNKNRGFSLKADYNLLPGESASFQSFLERLDASQAEYFVLKFKLDLKNTDYFPGRIRLTLRDWKHRSVVQDITALRPKDQTGWGEVVIPVKQFRPLDFDQLFSLRFTLLAKKEKMIGSLYIDEIAFFGFNDVAFESNRDNLIGFPKVVRDVDRAWEVSSKKSDAFLLREIARDTWKFFVNARDKDTKLIVDHIKAGDAPLAADYTSPTNIAMNLLSIIAAMDLGFIPAQEAEIQTREILTSLEKLRRYKGFFFNFYETKKLGVTRSYISSVDSGWLAIALVVVRQAFPDLGRKATEFLDSFDFEYFLDPENNHMIIGIDVPERNFGGYHYGMFVSEARATSFYAIGKGDLPESHWWFLYRTPPKAWNWQSQTPKGDYVTQDGFEYFQGYYEYQGKKFVPSWGGSLFEYLMPALVIKEQELAPNGLGLNNKRAAELHRDYALKEKKYPLWGISPAAVSDGRRWKYEEFGIRKLAVKGYPDRGVITPHVTFLALEMIPEDAVKNIRNFFDWGLYGEYGFYDSVNLRTKRVNPQYLALDQGMILVAICNYLKQGAIRERFHADVVGKKAEKLLLKESFFNT